MRHTFMTPVNASERLTPMVGTSCESTGSDPARIVAFKPAGQRPAPCNPNYKRNWSRSLGSLRLSVP